MRFGFFIFVLFCCLSVALPQPAAAEDYAPTRYGAALLAGQTYDPDSFGLLILQGQLLLDYDRVFSHAAPESLRFKLEANLGITTDGRNRGLAAVNGLALYYLEQFKRANWTPYVEAGVGVIYTDFQVDGQGLRFNFNPQAGVGVEYRLANGAAVTGALRLHHLSNGKTYRDNRGVNSALLMIGYLF